MLPRTSKNFAVRMNLIFAHGTAGNQQSCGSIALDQIGAE
jgi:hypothetical protein